MIIFAKVRLVVTTFFSCLMAAVFATIVPVAAATPGTLGEWQTNSNNLPQVMQNEAAVAYNGYMYVIGGQDSGGTPLNTVYYGAINNDGSIDSWTTNSHSLPTATTLETAVAYDGYVYVMGGYTSGEVSTVYSAPINNDGSIGSWTTSGNSLPQSLSNATSVVHDGYVYVIGGTDGSFYLNTVYYAALANDGTVGTWQTNANPLPETLGLATSYVHNGTVYVVGGFDGAASSDDIYYATLNGNGSTGTWTTSTTHLTKGVYGAGTALYDGYMFQYGGYNNMDIIGDAYSAPINGNASIGSFSVQPALPGTLTYFASVVYNGYAYAIGGGAFGTYNTVYYASLTGLPKPAVTDKSVNVTLNDSVTVDVLTGVSGNPDVSTLTIVSGPSHGTAVASLGSITYTPNADYSGSDSLVYRVCSTTDSSVCVEATLNFTVAAAIKAPQTGYAAPVPTDYTPLILVIASGVFLASGIGLQFIYKRKLTKR